ncbi:TPA: AAA family ATPase, partial [Escherichia coli]
FFKQLITDRKINKILNPLGNINISCSAMLDLMARKIPEFTAKSLIVLDGDVVHDNSANAKKAKKEKNLCLLPSTLPPDQMIFEFLYNLPPDDAYWENKNKFTKAVFMKTAKDIIATLKIGNAPIDLKILIDNYKKVNKNHGGRVRKLFKDFAHTTQFQAQVKGRVKDNPYRYWVEKNPVQSDSFKNELIKSLKVIMISGHGVDSATISSYLSDN